MDEKERTKVWSFGFRAWSCGGLGALGLAFGQAAFGRLQTSKGSIV